MQASGSQTTQLSLAIVIILPNNGKLRLRLSRKQDRLLVLH